MTQHKGFGAKKRPTPARRTYRPCLELLEARLAPALVHWNVDSDGFWDVASNWENNHVPASGDTAVLSRPSGSFTITVRDAEHVDVVQNSETLSIVTGGFIDIRAASSLGGSVQLAGGELSAQASGPITLSGNLAWIGGLLSGNGQGFINSGTVTLAGANDDTLICPLANTGTIAQTGTGNLVVNSTLNNNAGGLIDFQSDAGIAGNGDFLNSSTIQKSAGTGVSRIGPSTSSTLYFDQLGGTLDAKSGTLRLDQTRTDLQETGGAWNAEAGATLDFIGNNPSGTYFGGTFTGSGAGTVQLSSGNFYIQNSGATFNFPAGLLQWQGGTIGNQTLTNTGVIALAGSADKELDAVLNNNGTLADTGTGNLIVTHALNNNAAGLIDFQSDAGITGGGEIVNSGTVQKSAGTGVSRITPSSSNSPLYFEQLGGTLDAKTGTLRLDQTRTGIQETGGTWNAEAGATLDFIGNNGSGTYFGGTFTGSGAGTVQLSSGNFYIQNSGATFNFPAGLLQWQGGTIGNQTLTNTGVIALAGSADKELDAVLNNNGTLADTGTGNLIVTHALNNNAAGLIDFQSDAGITGGGEIVNSGTIQKSAGTGVSSITPSSSNSPLYLEQLGGTLDAKTGTLRLDQTRTGIQETGGTWNAEAGATLDFIGNNPSGTYFGGTFTGSGAGTVQLSSGIFYIQNSGATFNFPAGLLQWQGGTIGNQTLTNSGVITLTGSADKTLGATLNNNSIIDETGTGNLIITGVLNNTTSGLFDIQSDAGIVGYNTFTNSGLLRKSAGTGVSLMTPPVPNPGNANFNFNNTGGTIDAESGRLNLGSGGFWQSGTLNAGANAVLEISGGPAMTGLFTGAGAGRVEISGGLSPIDGGVAGALATFNFPKDYTHWTGGEIEGGGSGSGGSAQPLVNAGFLDIDGANSKTIRRNTLINIGTIVDAGPGDLILHGVGDFLGSTIDNRPGAIFEMRGDNTIGGNADVGAVINAGTFLKTAGTGIATISESFNSTPSGVIDVQTGTVKLNQGGTCTGGTFNVESGAILDLALSATVFGLTGSYTGSGAGTIQCEATLRGDDPTLRFNFAPGYFTMNAGALLGYIENDGALSFTGGTYIRANLTNLGTITQSGTVDLELNANTSIYNHGLYDIQSDVNLDVPADASGGNMQFLNSGTLRKSGGTGTALLRHSGSGKAFLLSNTGTVEVLSGTLAVVDPLSQLSGTTLTGGTWIVHNTAALTFPAGANITVNQGNVTLDGATASFAPLGGLANNQGTLTLSHGSNASTQGDFTNSGTLSAGPGSTFNVQGNLTEVPASRLQVQIGGRPASGQFGQVHVTGTANLAGSLAVQLAGGFGPTQGDVYAVLSYAGKQNGFGAIGGLNPFFTANVGATSVQLTAGASAVNLAVQSITVPAPSTVGQNVSIPFSVQNTTMTPVSGDWTDSVYLTRSTSFGPDAVLFARVPHTGGLAALGNYTATASAPMPSLIDGDYHVVVVADSTDQVPDTNRADNVLVSTATTHVAVPSLTLGAAANGTIANGQDQLYRIDVPAGGGDLVLSASFAVSREADLFLSYGALPGSASANATAAIQLGTQAELLIANPQAGSYYLLVHGREGAAAPQNFTLTPRLAQFEIRSVTPTHGSNTGSVTVTVSGSGFTPASTVAVVSGATSRTATAVVFKDSNTLIATFDLTGLATGAFDVHVVDGARSATAAGAFTVETGVAGMLRYTISVPTVIRAGATGQAIIDYANLGDTDLPAPVLLVTGQNAILRLSTQASYGDSQLEFLAIGNSGSAGVLAPGAHGEVIVDFAQQTTGPHVTSHIDVSAVNPQKPVDWTLVKDALRPPTMQQDAWDAGWGNVVADLGTTYTQYQAVMDQTATYLGKLGDYTADIARLLSFRMRIADDFGTISGRYALGPFGRGQADSLHITAVTDASGTVSISSAGAVRPFFPNPNGSFSALPGDTGTLTSLSGGGYQLTEFNGSFSVFGPDGRISYQQDSNANRLTWNYTGSAVTSLTSSNGDTTSFTYNAQGHVTQITDPVGRVTNYTYDNGGAGEHLIQISDPSGTTQIAYITGQGAALEHAVSSITLPDGSQRSFQYDSRGRLTVETRNGGLEPVTYSYDSVGGVTVTDAANNVTHIFRDDTSNTGRLIDPLGDAIQSSFDSNHLLSGFVNPGGLAVTIARDALGNPTQVGNPLGQTIALNYSADATKLTSVTAANGNQTQFAYDAHGNLTRQTAASGLPIQVSYDTRGNVIQRQLPSGKSETDTYDSHGLLTRRAFSDGTHIDLAHDAHRNLISSTDASGVTALQYDAADRLTEVSYPDGRSVKFQYDTFGRRSQLKTQDNFILNYSYDALGRLTAVKDAANNTLVAYTYDAIGRVSRETFGNGTSTSYAHDAFGNTSSVTNRASDNSVLSEFDYTHDAVGRTLTMTTAGATTNYGYDLLGQLISVSLPGGRTIGYQYDAAGNRTSVSDTAGQQSINYTSNNLDQLTAAGNAAFTYDADGNLATRTDSGGVTTYAYDVQNRLIAASGPAGNFTYEYDALGNRTAVVHNGVRTEYLVAPTGLGNVVGEYDGSGNLVAHYAQGSGLAGRIDAGGAAAYYQFDATGNVVGLTSPTGAVVNSYSYLPFGEKLSATGSTPNPFTYVGQAGVMDAGDGLYYMRHRVYDPGVGRFTQPDPTGLASGDTNPYRYAINNPNTFTDPTGLVAGAALTPAAQALSDALTAYLAGGGAAVVPATAAAAAPLTPAAAALSDSLAFAQTGIAPGGEGAYAAYVDAQATYNASLTFTSVTSNAPTAAVGAGGEGGAAVLGPLGLVIVVPTALIAGNRAAFNAEFNPEIQNVLNFTDADYLRHVRKAQNNHPLLDAVAQDIARNNGHSSPTAQDYLDAKVAIATASKNGTIEARAPGDPNDISGPAGFGAQGFVTPGLTFPYRIDFENEPTASAPAQVVTVSQELDANLDWTTFQLGSFGFGGQTFSVPAGLTTYSTRIDARATVGVYVDVSATFNTLTGLLTWTFKSIDPATGDLPADILTGFLPPDTNDPQGTAFVSFTVLPKSGLATGATIAAKATVIFDAGLADQSSLDTATIQNTIDAGAPTSSVAALPAFSQSSFTVSWAGQDDAAGSGIASFDVYVSDNGGAFTPLLTGTKLASTTFTGVNGHTYGFYSIATDNVGNRQAAPNGAQATTQVTLPPGFSYDLNKVLTITGTAAQNTFTFSQATTVDAAGKLHTLYTFTLNANSASFPDTALANVVVGAQGAGNTAVLITNDTYVDLHGQTQETQETIALGSNADAGAGSIQKVDASGKTFNFLTLSHFPISYAYVGRNDGTVQLFGTSGVPYNGFVSAGNYSYMGGPGLFHLVQGAASVYGYSAGQPTDFAYHYTANAGSAFVVSGTAFSYMSTTDTVNGVTQPYFNVGVGFLVNTGVSKNPGQDYAYIIDSPGNDTFVGGTAYSYMYMQNADNSFAELDTAYAFALVFGESFVGGTDTALNNDPNKNILAGFGHAHG